MLTYILLPFGALLAYRYYIMQNLRFFEPAEFGFQGALVSGEVLLKLDKFREYLNKPVMISPADGAVIRLKGDNFEHSDHFYGKAVDVMLPQGPGLENAYNAARAAGFNAIGIYPFWKPYKGLHLGVRHPRNKLFTWADIGRNGQHNFVAITEGFKYG